MERPRLTPPRRLRRPVEVVDDTVQRERLLREREDALQSRIGALESGDFLVRLNRGSHVYPEFVGEVARDMAQGGEVRPEVLRVAIEQAERVIRVLYQTNRRRYVALHNLTQVNLARLDPMVIAQENLRYRAQQTLEQVLRETPRVMPHGEEDRRREALLSAADVDALLGPALGMRVEAEVEYDPIENQVRVVSVSTRRNVGENVTVSG